MPVSMFYTIYAKSSSLGTPGAGTRQEYSRRGTLQRSDFSAWTDRTEDVCPCEVPRPIYVMIWIHARYELQPTSDYMLVMQQDRCLGGALTRIDVRRGEAE